MEKNVIIGSNIRDLRENAGFSQQSIAAFLKVDQSLVSKIEKGERSISADMLEKISALFGVEASDIMKENMPLATLSCAFRCNELTFEEMEAVSAVNRIALNTEFMKKISEGRKDD